MIETAFETDLDYLEQELNWIECRCKRIITEKLLRDFSSEDDAAFYNQVYVGDLNLEAMQARLGGLSKKERKLRMTIDSRLAINQDQGQPAGVDELCRLYTLDEFERNILLLAASVAFSRRFLQLFSRLWDGYESLTVEAIFAFCEFSFSERITRLKQLGRTGNLFRHELVSLNMGSRINSPQDLLDAQITIANRTFDFMLGGQQIMDEFMEFSSVEEPRAEIDQVVLNARDKDRIRSVVKRHDRYLQCRQAWGFDEIIKYGKGILMLFYGKPGTGKTMMAHAVASEMGMRVLNVDIPTFINHYDAQRFLPALFREAKMQNAVLFFDECEALFAMRSTGNPLMTLLLTEIERFEGVAILATNLPQQLDDALDRRILVRVNFPSPDRLARREIWQKHLPPQAPVADDVDLDALAEQFEIAGGYIKNAVLMAVAESVHTGGDSPQITMAILEKAAREQSTPSSQADSPVTRFNVDLQDVVLPPATRNLVDELVLASRSQKSVLERGGFDQLARLGSPVSAVLFGPSGTGKTLTARAVARALNRPVRTVSIVGVASDWGATQHALTSALQDAKEFNAVLVVDHADALFDDECLPHARWLASELDVYDGLVLLLANSAIPAEHPLVWKLTYQIAFSMPEADERAVLWARWLPGLDVTPLVKHDFSGAQIQSLATRAAFTATRAGAAVRVEDVIA